MKQQQKLYPVGIQTFSELRTKNYLYVDKTEYVYRMTHAAICGITEEEILTQMPYDLELLAERINVSRNEALAKLKNNYDGYHFTWPSPDIYNPFSLFNAFEDGRLNSYWFGSGTPTYLIEMLSKYGVKPQQIGGRKALATSFDAPTEKMTNIAPLLYQSGYITIKDYSVLTELYTLDIPNKEVRMPLGRVGMVMRTATTLYVVELKLNKSADAAMQQIDLKHYPKRFALCGLPVMKVGIDFDGKGHTLGGWKIEGL